MKIGNYSIQRIIIIFTLLLITGCAPALTPTPIPVETDATSNPVVPTDANVSGYQPVSAEVCQILQEAASQSLGLTFTLEASVPFTDYSSGETGLGCSLTATTNGAAISSPQDALTKLVNGFVGWTEDSTKYGADGPTGSATGLTRDSGVLLIGVSWQPSAEVSCPADQPIDSCPLTPEQKIYTVNIQAAQK
ncbi:MAG: hypothetical protein H7Y59_04540 [Anaerolineales bacterium]|nr:hypothetical protein [Anaerolineales bacterium]